MQDDKTRWSLTTPLTPEQLAWWQERMRRTIYHIRETFPRARLVYRKLHRTDDLVAGTQYITNRACPSPVTTPLTTSSVRPAFLARRCPLTAHSRVHQLRHLQEEVAKSEGLPTFGASRAPGPGSHRRLWTFAGGVPAVPGEGAPAADPGRGDVRAEPGTPAAARSRRASHLVGDREPTRCLGLKLHQRSNPFINPRG